MASGIFGVVTCQLTDGRRFGPTARIPCRDFEEAEAMAAQLSSDVRYAEPALYVMAGDKASGTWLTMAECRYVASVWNEYKKKINVPYLASEE